MLKYFATILIETKERIYQVLMPTLPCEDQLAQFQLFRQNLYSLCPSSRDSVMDLLDALSGNGESETIK